MKIRTYRTRHTKADVQRALKDLEALYAPTERERIEDRMSRAKEQFSEAAALTMKGDKTAAARAKSALEAVERVRAALAQLDAAEGRQ